MLQTSCIPSVKNTCVAPAAVKACRLPHTYSWATTTHVYSVSQRWYRVTLTYVKSLIKWQNAYYMIKYEEVVSVPLDLSNNFLWKNVSVFLFFSFRGRFWFKARPVWETLRSSLAVSWLGWAPSNEEEGERERKRGGEEKGKGGTIDEDEGMKEPVREWRRCYSGRKTSVSHTVWACGEEWILKKQRKIEEGARFREREAWEIMSIPSRKRRKDLLVFVCLSQPSFQMVFHAW